MKTILHLCADIGSDSRLYSLHPDYNVIRVGKDIGVEKYHPGGPIHGVIANPPCTESQYCWGFHIIKSLEESLELVNHCIRIIKEATPAWYVIENPANGRLKEFLGPPKAVYQPWQYGSPWTKKTALWGSFNMPEPIYASWDDCPKNPALYQRPGRGKPSLAFLHRAAVNSIPEFYWARDMIKTDADLRSMCSQGFAQAFFEANT